MVELYTPNVIPVFKVSNTKCTTDHRLVTLTPVPGKMMNTNVRDKLTDLSEDMKSITDNHHGFR